MANNPNVIVVGAGVGGLSVAIRLALLGFSVKVFEKNSYPGGKLSYFEQDGYRFDAGPSLFTQPGNIEDLFALTGEPIDAYFSYRRSSIGCRYFFSNGKQVTAWADKLKFAADMEAQVGEPSKNVLEYLQRSSQLYNNVGALFLQHSLHRPTDFSWKEIRNALRSVKLPYLFQSLDHYNENQFKTPEARQLFNRYATYNGSNPYKAPAMLSLIPHLEMNEGTFYPEGGMISITNALYKLAVKMGVEFHFDATVNTILHDKGRIKGVNAGGVFYAAPVVVSNQDVYFTYKYLLENELRATKVLKQERSSSALIFYWGIGKSFPQLDLHNIFFSSNYKAEFEGIFKSNSIIDDPTVYINITSKMEAAMAPGGKENWFVMVNVPANCGQNWDEITAITRKIVIEKLSRILDCNIAALIETEATLDPVSIESKTMSFMGSLYGTSSNSKMAAFLRHPNFNKAYSGLYFVGGSVHPGGGIPLCLRSAAIAADIIKKEMAAGTY